MTASVGRLVVDVQTNKSGGAVAYGDVVINDATTAHSFTTTTTGGFTAGTIGVCIEPNGIASNATGRIQTQGYCAQVNTNASVTLGYFLKTHTVAKQATGSATRVVGSFGVAMSTATNPAVMLWGFPDASSATGNVATDAIWDAAGDLAVGTGADTAAKLTKGAAGTVPTAGASTLAYAFPPGYEIDYVATTSQTALSATTEGTANTILTSNNVAYDGTAIYIECFLPQVYGSTTANTDVHLVLLEDSTVLGAIMGPRSQSTNRGLSAIMFKVKRTPSAASHTYTVKGFVDSGAAGSAGGGAGGSGNLTAGYIRTTKV
jgi:hypothetical protein